MMVAADAMKNDIRMVRFAEVRIANETMSYQAHCDKEKYILVYHVKLTSMFSCCYVPYYVTMTLDFWLRGSSDVGRCVQREFLFVARSRGPCRRGLHVDALEDFVQGRNGPRRRPELYRGLVGHAGGVEEQGIHPDSSIDLEQSPRCQYRF